MTDGDVEEVKPSRPVRTKGSFDMCVIEAGPKRLVDPSEANIQAAPAPLPSPPPSRRSSSARTAGPPLITAADISLDTSLPQEESLAPSVTAITGLGLIAWRAAGVPCAPIASSWAGAGGATLFKAFFSGSILPCVQIYYQMAALYKGSAAYKQIHSALRQR